MKFIILAALLALTGCSSERTPEEQRAVRLVFVDSDGCRVYEYWNGSKMMNYANCNPPKCTEHSCPVGGH